MNKTYSEWLKDQSPYPEYLSDLPPGTAASIFDRFESREICDNDKFDRYFRRTITNYKSKFETLLMIEGIKFDPMVNRYLEAQQIRNGTGSNRGVTYNDFSNKQGGSGNVTTDTTTKDTESYKGLHTAQSETHNTGLNSSEEETNNSKLTTGSLESIGSNMHSGTVTTSGRSAGETHNTSDSSNDSVTRKADKVAPMSASGVTSAAAGEGQAPGPHLANLDFSYASQYAQQDNAGRNIGKNDENKSETHSESVTTTERNSDTRKDSNTGRETDKGGRKVQARDKRDENKNDTDRTDDKRESDGNVHAYQIDQRAYTDEGTSRKEDTVTTQTSDTSTNRITGREGLTPQEAKRQAEEYLRRFNPAIEWFLGVLETCIIGIYDI